MMMQSVLYAVLLGAALAHKKGKGAAPAPEVPEPVVNDCNSTCLTLEAYDFYGDGWDSVMLHGEVEGGAAWSMAPDCRNKMVQHQICPDADGTYFFTAVHMNASYIPENYWEVFWKATSHNCDGSVANVYTGGFNSSLIMDYVGVEWSVQYWENLWDNEKQCDACGDAKVCAPKKPKGKKGNKKGRNKPGHGNGGGPYGKGSADDDNSDDMATGKSTDDDLSGDDDTKNTTKPEKSDDDDRSGDDDTKNTTYTFSMNTTNTGKSKPRYGPPAVNVRVTMFDEHGDGWWKEDYSGESWYLADDRREKLFNTGTLCDGSIGSCNLCLGDGSYTMRFTGVNTNNFTAWDVCGVTGHRGSELTFHVLKGECIADSVVSLETDCSGTVSTKVSLTGVVAISGFTTELVSEGHNSVLANALASMIDGWEAENIQVISTSLDSRSEVSSTSRKLSDFTQDFTFVVSFIAEEAFHVDGRSYANLENLASSLATILSNKMSSGWFESTLQLQMAASGLTALASTSTAELLSLEIGTFDFIGSEPIVKSTLPAPDFSAHTTEKTISSYNVPTITAFFGVALMGFVAFVGIIRQNWARAAAVYDSLPDDSVRAADVQESEMETSNSPMIKAAFQVEDSSNSLRL